MNPCNTYQMNVTIKICYELVVQVLPKVKAIIELIASMLTIIQKKDKQKESPACRG